MVLAALGPLPPALSAPRPGSLLPGALPLVWTRRGLPSGNCVGWELSMCISLPASELAANVHNDSNSNETGLDISGKDVQNKPDPQRHRLTAVLRQKTRHQCARPHGTRGGRQVCGRLTARGGPAGAGAFTPEAGKNRLNSSAHILWEDGQTKLPQESTV